MASTYDVFVKAERVERLAGEIYQAVARAFPDAPEVPTLRQLAEEEEQHAARLRLLALRYRASPRLFDSVDFKLHALDDLVAEAQAVLREIAAGRWAGNLAGLLAKLVELETRGSISHAEVLADAADPKVADFFRQMAAQDRAHAALLGR